MNPKKPNFLLLIFSILISYFLTIKATMIKESFHFFDIFYYKDLYKDYLKQISNNKCTLDQGPNCFFIPKNISLISKELTSIYPDQSEFIKQNPENIFLKLKEEIQLIGEKDTESIEDKLYSFDSPYVMSLFLTFESYDEKTKYYDIYAPETIDTPFDIGRVTLTILGKLRISQKNSKLYEMPNSLDIKDERPKGSYAYVESKEVLIKFNSKSIISSLYIKKNKYNTQNKNFYLYGYKDNKKYLIAKMQNVPSSSWIKVSGDSKKYDSILLIRGFDYDNFVINSQVNKDNSVGYEKINQKYSEAMKEKINIAIKDAMKEIKSGDIKKIKENGENIKIVQIELNNNDIKTDDEEDYDIPDELMEELENNYIKNNNKMKEEKIIENNDRNNIQNINKNDL